MTFERFRSNVIIAIKKFFVDISRTLSDIHLVESIQGYLLQRNKLNMKFNFVQANEIYIDIVIKKLKNKSSYGYDFISNKHIKYARSVLTKALILLIIPCLHTGIHPTQLNISLYCKVEINIF